MPCVIIFMTIVWLGNSTSATPQLTDFAANPNRSVWTNALGSIQDPTNVGEVWTVTCDSCAFFIHANYFKAYVSSTTAQNIVDGTNEVALGISGSVGISIERIAIIVYPFCDPSLAGFALITNMSIFNPLSICVFPPQSFPARQVLITRIMQVLRNFSGAPLFSYSGSAVGR